MRWPLLSALFVLLFTAGVICQDVDSTAEFPEITKDPNVDLANEAPKPEIQPGAPEVVVESPPNEGNPVETAHADSQGDAVTIAPGADETFPPEVTEQDPFATTAALELTTKATEGVEQAAEDAAAQAVETPKEETPEAAAEAKPEETPQAAMEEPQPSETAPESPPVSPVVIEEAPAVTEAAAHVADEAPKTSESAPVAPEVNASVTEDPLEASMNDDVFAGDKAIFEGTMGVPEVTSASEQETKEEATSPGPVFPRIELPAETGEDKEPEAVLKMVTPLEGEAVTEATTNTENQENEMPFAPAVSFKPTDTETTPVVASETPVETPAPEPSPEPTAEPTPVEVTKEASVESEPTTEIVPVVVAEEEPKASPEPEPEPEPKAEPEPTAEPTKAEAEVEVEATPEPVSAVPEPEPEPKAEPEPEPTAEPTIKPKAEPEPEPSAEPEPEPTTEPQPGPSAEPSAEPSPEPTAEPQPEPTSEPEPSVTPEVAIDEHHHHHQHAHAIVSPPAPNAEAHRMPFSIRFPNIEFNDEFLNTNSGSFKKLNDQISHDFRKVLSKVLGDNFIDYEVVEMRPGSVIVEGRIVTKQEVMDPESVVEQVEQVIEVNGGALGGNPVDTKSITVNGFVSKGNIEPVSDPAATKTGMVIFGAIGIGFLIIAAAIVAIVVFGIRKRNAKRDVSVMNRRTNSLKLKENIDLAENGRSSYQPPGNVNLMSYGRNGTPSTTNGAAADNKNSAGMVMTSSQFSSPSALQTTST